MSLTCLLPYLQILLLMCDIAHAFQHLLCLIILRTVLPPPQSHPPCHGIPGAGSWTNVYKDPDLSLQEIIKMYAKKETTKHTVVTNTFIHIQKPSYLLLRLQRQQGRLRPDGAGSVGRSQCCTTLLRGRLVQEASRGWGSHAHQAPTERRECVCECVSGRDSFPKLQQGEKRHI